MDVQVELELVALALDQKMVQKKCKVSLRFVCELLLQKKYRQTLGQVAVDDNAQSCV